MRIPIKRSPVWIPILVLFGATESRSYLDVAPDRLRARFGWWRVDIPRERITDAAPARWPILGGIGWRSNLRSMVGLIGAQSPVVKIDIDPPVRTRLLGIPLNLRHLYVSVDNPDFVRAAVLEGAA